MKAIKYRIWDKEFKDMIYSNTDEPRVLEDTSLNTDFMISLYIWDVKSKEIYDSDIVKNLNTGEISEITISDVMIENFGYPLMIKTIVLKDLKTKFRKPMDVFNETYEVIGNIYETPELLEVLI